MFVNISEYGSVLDVEQRILERYPHKNALRVVTWRVRGQQEQEALRNFLHIY